MWLFSIEIAKKHILYNWKLKPDQNKAFSLAGLKATCVLFLMKRQKRRNIYIPHDAGAFCSSPEVSFI